MAQEATSDDRIEKSALLDDGSRRPDRGQRKVEPFLLMETNYQGHLSAEAEEGETSGTYRLDRIHSDGSLVVKRVKA